MKKSAYVVVLLLLSTMLFIGCGGGEGDASTPVEKKLTALSITPNNPTTPLGNGVAFSAKGTYSTGEVKDLSALVAWSSSKTGIASFSGKNAHSHKVGDTSITATYGGVDKTTTLRVTQAAISTIDVASEKTELIAGTHTNFTASATYTDATTQDMTQQVTWRSANSRIATVDSEGKVTGHTKGNTTIYASYGSHTNGHIVIIKAAILREIDANPKVQTIPKGLNGKIDVNGTYSNGNVLTIASGLDFNSSATSVVSVDENGVLLAKDEGNSTITVTKDAFTDTVEVHISKAILTSLKIKTPIIESLAKGRTLQATLAGIYSDGREENITENITWESLDTNISTIDTNGTATATNNGTAEIKATVGTVSTQTSFLVTDAVLDSIAIQTTMPDVPKGLTAQLKAVGTYSDGTTFDLTSVEWTSSEITKAVVSKKGLVTANEEGNLTITAKVGDITSDTFSMTILPPVLQSFYITTESKESLAGHNATTLITMKHYSDNTDINVSKDTTWVSQDSGILSVDANGTILAKKWGTTTIYASHEGNTTQQDFTVTDEEMAKTITFEEAHAGVEGKVNINDLNKIDYYDINLTADNYTMYTELLTGTTGRTTQYFKIDITDPSGGVVLNYSKNANIGTLANATFTAPTDGIYRVRITREGNSATKYKFSFDK